MDNATTLSRHQPATRARPVVTSQHVFDTLNMLIETCADGAYGFASCADYSNISRHRTLFRQRAKDCDEAGAQLHVMLLRLGGQPAQKGSAAGMLPRGWVAVRGTLSGLRDRSILAECERGESVAFERYQDALKQNLPIEVRALVQRQCAFSESNLDQMRLMRDAKMAAN